MAVAVCSLACLRERLVELVKEGCIDNFKIYYDISVHVDGNLGGLKCDVAEPIKSGELLAMYNDVLHWAIHYKQPDFVSFLLKHPVMSSPPHFDIEWFIECGDNGKVMTSILRAVMCNDPVIVKLIMNYSTYLSIDNLISECYKHLEPSDPYNIEFLKTIDILYFFIDEYSDKISHSMLGLILYWASDKGNLKFVTRLLSLNCIDINYVNSTSGMTALMVASTQGNLNIIRVLIQFNASVTLCTPNSGWNAIDYASTFGQYDIVDYFTHPFRIFHDSTTNENKFLNLDLNSSISNAVFRGHHEVVKLLLSRGASANDTKFQGLTLLNYCCQRNYIEIAKILIQAQANINYVSNNGYTPLFTSIMSSSVGLKNIEMCTLLINNGADIEIKDVYDRTALFLACERDDENIIELLLKYNADTKVKNNAGLTAFEITNNPKILKMLNDAYENKYNHGFLRAVTDNIDEEDC